MRIKFLFSILITCFTVCASAQFEPTIVNTKSNKKILLGKKIQKVLIKEKLSFKPIEILKFSKEVQGLFKKSKKELPMSITADFNGDNIVDLAVLGKTKKNYKLLAFTSLNNSYKMHEIASWSPKVFKKIFSTKGKFIRYLSLITKKQIKSPSNFKKDAFQLETYQGYTELLYWDGDSFKINKGALKL